MEDELKSSERRLAESAKVARELVARYQRFAAASGTCFRPTQVSYRVKGKRFITDTVAANKNIRFSILL